MGVWCVGGGCGLWVRVGGGVVVMVVAVVAVGRCECEGGCGCVCVGVDPCVCGHRRDSGARRSHSREGRGGHTREDHRFDRSSRAFGIHRNDRKFDVSTPCEQKQGSGSKGYVG